MTETSDIWTGKASSYDRARPTPPPALLDLLTQLIDTPRPTLVVDLGSGTGLSTAIWGERAEQVIGNVDILAIAAGHNDEMAVSIWISARRKTDDDGPPLTGNIDDLVSWNLKSLKRGRAW